MRTVFMIAATLCWLCAGMLPVQAAPESLTFVAIGTGATTGVYYPTGTVITNLVNAKRLVHGLSVSVEATGGSVFNINALMRGDLEFGLAQADRQYEAYHGKGEWEGRPQQGLRSVFSLAPEVITLVVAEDSGIRSLQDLQGKVINIGNVGSGGRQNALDVLQAAGLSVEFAEPPSPVEGLSQASFSQTDSQTETRVMPVENPDRAGKVEPAGSHDVDERGQVSQKRHMQSVIGQQLRASDASRLLQEGGIDGLLYTVSHPNGNTKEAISGTRPCRILPVASRALLQASPLYTAASIDMALYPAVVNRQEVVQSVGIPATFVTSQYVPDAVVYAVVKEVFEHFGVLQSFHPALAGLTKKSMLQGLTAPLHPGAQRYYQEVGLIP